MHYEIERKYLIAMPEEASLAALPGAEKLHIRQCYLPDNGGRLREVQQNGETTYIFTQKRRINDVTREETERVLSPEEYRALFAQRDTTYSVIEKTRWRIPWQRLTAEVDIFPFWPDLAYLEFELPEENVPVPIPPWLHVIREVTHDRRYTNRALAREIPTDEI